MDKSVTDNAAEQIAVNPDQTAQLVKNESKLQNTSEYLSGVFDPNIVTKKTNNTLNEISDWSAYLADPVVATQSVDPKFEKLGPTMDMARDPVWYSLAQKYGKDLTHKTDVLLGYYKPRGSKLSRAIDAYRFQADSLELAKMRRKLSDAVAANDTEAQAEYENKIAHLKNRLEHYDAPLNSFAGDSIEAIAASVARTGPVILAIETGEKIIKGVITGAEVAGAAATGGTSAGVSIPVGELAKRGVGAVATAAETALVYKDTYNVEYGSVLHDIMTAMPDIPEEKAREIADFVGKVNGGIEAGGTLVGTGIAKLVGADLASGVIGQAGRKSLWGALKVVAKKGGPEATRAALSRIFKEAADMGIDILSNDAQEMLQAAVSAAGTKAAAGGGDVAKLSASEVMGFLKDPLAPQYQYLREEGLGTTYGVGAMIGATRLLTGAVAGGSRAVQNAYTNRRQPRTVEQQAIGAAANTALADKLHEIRKDSQVPDEAQKKLWEQTTARGIAPENIYLDKQMAEALVKDPGVTAAMEKLGIQAALQESESNGGLVEIDFATYDEVVNKDDALYQKIRTAISFSPEALSMNQFQAYIDSLGAATREEIDRARALTDSVYNQTLEKLAAMGITGPSAESQAYVSQFIANRVATMRLGQTETGEQAFSRLEIRMPGQQTESVELPPVDTSVFDAAYEKSENTTGAERIISLGDDDNTTVFVAKTPELGWTIRMTDDKGMAKIYTKDGTFVDISGGAALPTNIRGFDSESRALLAARDAVSREIAPEQAGASMPQPFGETIVVDGKERPTRNSNNEPIATTKEELVGFWRWFGDSKAVDEQGRPLVAYHGTNKDFEGLDVAMSNNGSLGRGLYFFDKRSEAEKHGSRVISAYLKIENPAPQKKTVKATREAFQGGKFDGVIFRMNDGSIGELVVKDQSQVRQIDDGRGGGVLHQFVGGGVQAGMQKVAPELFNRYKKAQQMMFEGKGDDEIFKETHIHIAPDGSLRVQISDKDSKVLPAMKTKLGWKPKEKKYTMRRKTTLGEVFSHPILFELYPWLKDAEVSISKTTQEYTKKYRENGVVTRMEHFIEIKNDEPDSRLRQSFLHEIQHAIQDHEGWAKGGRAGSSSYIPTQEERSARDERNKLLKEVFETLHDNKVITYWDASDSRVPTYRTLEPGESRTLGKVMEDVAKDNPAFAEQLKRLKELNKTLENYDEHDPRMKYFQLFGEAEARLTEKLSYMSQEELDALDPYQYFDVTQARVKMSRSDRGFWVSLPENQQKVGEFDVELGFTEDTEPMGGTGVIAGTFFREGDKLVISLTPNANATTLTHELFHWFSYELQDAYNSGVMTDYWKKKVEAMARMVGAQLEVDPVDPNVKRLYLTPAQEEKAANMFLSFVKDGKIQNQEVRPLFSYLQDEFRRIFKLANMQGYKMNPDAYELFNSIFSAQDVIEDEQRMVGMLQIVKPENADQDLYDFYTGEMTSSQVRGTQELHKKWARIDKFRKGEDYRKLYDEVRLEVAQELNQDTRYLVVEEASRNGNDALATWNALMTNPETADLELSVDQVADIIANTPDKTAEIDRITNERMNEYVQKEYQITPEEMGLKASRNASKVKALLAEALMREGKTLADFDAAYSELSSKADRQVEKSTLHRLADKEYWDTLESNIVERYAYALINKDDSAMATARRDQAIVNAIRMRAEAVTNRAKRFQEVAAEFRGAQKKISKTNEFKYAAKDYDLLQSILEKFGFPINYARRKPAPVAEKLNTWIDEQEATTMTRAGELRNFIPFINEGYAGTFPSMTDAQFEKLEAVFNAVKSVAGAKYSIILENDKALLSELVASTNKNMEALGIGPFNKKDSYWAKHFGVMSTFTNPEPIVRAIFPQDVLNKVWLPFIDAGVRAERYGREWVERYRTAKGKVDISNKAKTYSTGRTLTNRDVADLLLSMGNQHAFDNFILSYDNMTAQEAEQIVSEALVDQPGLADFAKEVWDIYAKASEQLDQEFEARTNTLFVEKDHRSFEINGIKFAGGYVPARKALDYVPTDARAGNQGGMVRDKRFEKLITKKADGNIRSIIDITENELFQSAKQGFSAVEFNNARKFLLADGTKAAIGDRAFSFLSQWMEAYIAPQYDTSAWIRPLQKITSISALGWRFSTALIQLSGLGPAAVELGPTYWARGIAMAMKNGEWAPYFATKKGANKSDYMFTRIADPRSSLLGNSIIDSVRATDAKTELGRVSKYLMGKVGNSAMWGIQYVDTVVANATWNGAYLRGLDKGLSEIEARREADSVVRVVQSDSLKISRSQGMQDPLARVFTVFATWIMAMQSNLRALIGTKRYANALLWASMYMLLSPIFEAFLKEATKPEVLFGDDDDEDYVDRVLKSCYNEIANTVGTSFFPVAGLGGTGATMLLSGLEERLTGEKNMFKPYQSNVPVLQTTYRGLNALRYGLAGDLEKAATYGAATVSTEAGKIVKYLLAE